MPNWVAFISGWMLWFAYIVACSLYAADSGRTSSSSSRSTPRRLRSTLESTLGDTGTVVMLTVLIAVAFLALNIVGTHATGQAENVITVAKIAILAVFIGFGIAAVVNEPSVARENFEPFLTTGTTGVLAAMGLIFIAFEGYDLIATVSEEVKDPEANHPQGDPHFARDHRRHLHAGGVCHTGRGPFGGRRPNLGGHRRFRRDRDHRCRGSLHADVRRAARPVRRRLRHAECPQRHDHGVVSGGICHGARLDADADELYRLHATRKTPVLAISITGVLLIAIAAALPLETIGAASSLFFLLTFMLVNVVLIVYRRRSTDSGEETFRAPWFPVTPVLGVLTTGGLAGFLLFNDRLASILAAVWVLVGLVVFVTFFRRRVGIADVRKTIETPTLLDLKRVARFRVIVPIANPERIGPLLSIATQVAKAAKGDVLALRVLRLPDVTSYGFGEPLVDDRASTARHGAADDARRGRVVHLGGEDRPVDR